MMLPQKQFVTVCSGLLWLWIHIACLLPLSYAEPLAVTAQAHPVGVSCVLRIAGGRTQFHVGERIPLEIIFSSPSGSRARYQVNTDAGDRTLMWNTDTFRVSPADGVSDPLDAYLKQSRAGGWTSYNGPGPQWQALGSKPIVIPLDLNQWERFDRPGHYQVVLTCRRLMAGSKQMYDLFFKGIPTTTNEIDLDILPPDAAWAAAQIRQALPAYYSADETYKTEAERRMAARTLRFLDTPESIVELVRRYGTLTEFDYLNSRIYFETRLGLFGSAHQDFVVHEMRRQIAASDFSVTQQFLDDLTEVQSLAKQTGDAAGMSLLARALPQKYGRALAVSLATLQQSSQSSLIPGTKESSLQRRARQDITRTFDMLPAASQSELLEEPLWPLVRSPAMLPALRRLYHQASGIYVEGGVLALRDQALGRIAELSPTEGRHLELAEIRLRHPQLEVRSLTDLPDRTLPDLDNLLVMHLFQSAHLGDDDAIDLQSQLIARYATAAILPRVKAFYRVKGGYSEWWTPTQPALLAYFLRVDPAYGAKMLRHDIGARRPSITDYFDLLRDVSAIYMCPALEQVAINSLNDPCNAVVCDAADVLGTHGSAAAEAPLWSRLRRWNTQWGSQKADQLARRKQTSMQARPEVALAAALALSPAWVADRNALAKIKKLCLAPDALMQAQVDYVDEGKHVTLHGDELSNDGTEDQWRVAQYTLTSLRALRQKLAQYPAGTEFVWDVYDGMPHPERTAQVFFEVRAFLKQRGKRLVKAPHFSSAM